MNIDERIDLIEKVFVPDGQLAGDELAARKMIKQLLRDVLEHVTPSISNLQYSDVKDLNSDSERAAFMVGYDYGCRYFEDKAQELGL